LVHPLGKIMRCEIQSPGAPLLLRTKGVCAWHSKLQHRNWRQTKLVRYPIRREIETEGLNLAEASVAKEQTTLAAMCKSRYI
jgi:hypothetical protein